MIYFANQGTLLLKHIINGRNINALVSSSEHFFFFCCVACGILVPRPGIELVPPALEAWGLNHWTTREVPLLFFSSSSNPSVQALVPVAKQSPPSASKHCLFIRGSEGSSPGPSEEHNLNLAKSRDCTDQSSCDSHVLLPLKSLLYYLRQHVLLCHFVNGLPPGARNLERASLPPRQQEKARQSTKS